MSRTRFTQKKTHAHELQTIPLERKPSLTYNQFKREAPNRGKATSTRKVLNDARSTPQLEADRSKGRLMAPDTAAAETR